MIYSKPTHSQVNDFISQKSFDVKAIKEASEFTIIAYQEGKKSGYFIVYQDQNSKVLSAGGYGTINDVTKVDHCGVASGKEPFVTIIINDDDLYNQADYLEVTFDDGTIVREKVSERGIVVIYEKNINSDPVSFINVDIYDKANNLIYEY